MSDCEGKSSDCHGDALINDSETATTIYRAAEMTCLYSETHDAPPEGSEAMSSVWHQEPPGFSPCMEIDSSSVRCKERLTSPAWLKQEQDDLRIIKWESCQTGTSADAVQDNTPSSAMSGKSGGSFQTGSER